MKQEEITKLNEISYKRLNYVYNEYINNYEEERREAAKRHRLLLEKMKNMRDKLIKGTINLNIKVKKENYEIKNNDLKNIIDDAVESVKKTLRNNEKTVTNVKKIDYVIQKVTKNYFKLKKLGI